MSEEKRTVVGVEGGAPVPCVFQRLRLVGKELDGELAQLVPPGLTSAQTDAVIPAGTPLPSRSLFAESRIPPSHLPPLFSTPVPTRPPCAPLENYMIEYQWFDSTRVHFAVHPCEVTTLMINDFTIERCTRRRKRIRQIAAHNHASRAFVRGLPVRQDLISAPGAQITTSCIPLRPIFVRLFGRMTKGKKENVSNMSFGGRSPTGGV